MRAIDGVRRSGVGVRPQRPIRDAAVIMDQAGVGSLAVIDDDRLVGIVTERDYLRRVTLENRDERVTPVSEIMTREIAYVTPATSIEECMAVMTERRIRHLPVLSEEKQVVGIVSIGDVVKFQSQEQRVQIEFLTEYISG